MGFTLDTKLLKVPFLKGGRDRTQGLDCWGMVMEVFRGIGVHVPELGVTMDHPASVDALVEAQTQVLPTWEEVPEPRPEEFTLVLLRNGKYWNHAGVHLPDGRVIHTTEATGPVVERMDGPLWRHRPRRYFRRR